MRKRVAVVIPYYHNDLSEFEIISFQSCLNILRNYPIILVVPESMTQKSYPSHSGLIYEKVPDIWMESVKSYNQMMLSKQFYIRFKQYEYILIFQLDAFVISDCLNQFCCYGYDYIGAPWINGMKYLKDLDSKAIWYVGNGGFSLRRVSAFLKLLDSGITDYIEINEDVFWASCDSEQFQVAPIDVALQFAFEKDVYQCYQMNHNRLPFGCHAWEKYNFEFWKSIIEMNGYNFKTEILEKEEKDYQIKNYHYLEIDSETMQQCLNRLFCGEKRELYVFGAGRWGKECYWLLKHNGVQNIRCIDSNPEIWGNYLWDTRIESPDILSNKEAKNIFIIIAIKYLKNKIFNNLSIMGYQYMRDILYYDDFIRLVETEF